MITIYGRHDGDVVFSEGTDADWERIPARVVHVLHYDASIKGAKHISWGGKEYLRGSLEAIRKDLDAKALPELDTCTFDGCENPAPFQLADARPRCVTHAKEN